MYCTKVYYINCHTHGIGRFWALDHWTLPEFKQCICVNVGEGTMKGAKLSGKVIGFVSLSSKITEWAASYLCYETTWIYNMSIKSSKIVHRSILQPTEMLDKTHWIYDLPVFVFLCCSAYLWSSTWTNWLCTLWSNLSRPPRQDSDMHRTGNLLPWMCLPQWHILLSW